MHTFKNTAFFLVVSLTFAMNARLYSDASAIFAYSTADYDPWYVDCYYYKPVEIFRNCSRYRERLSGEREADGV